MSELNSPVTEFEQEFKQLVPQFFKSSNKKTHAFYVETLRLLGFDGMSRNPDFVKLVVCKLEFKRINKEANKRISEVVVKNDELQEEIDKLKERYEAFLTSHIAASKDEIKKYKKEEYFRKLKTEHNNQTKAVRRENKRLQKANRQLICKNLQLEGNVQQP